MRLSFLYTGTSYIAKTASLYSEWPQGTKLKVIVSLRHDIITTDSHCWILITDTWIPMFIVIYVQSNDINMEIDYISCTNN